MTKTKQTMLKKRLPEKKPEPAQSKAKDPAPILHGIRLNPATARNAVILHEIIGPPVSKRPRQRAR